MPKLIKNWDELSEISNESNTHVLEVDTDFGGAWIYPRNHIVKYEDEFLENISYHGHIYLSTHAFYEEFYEEYTKILQACGFDVELRIDGNDQLDSEYVEMLEETTKGWCMPKRWGGRMKIKEKSLELLQDFISYNCIDKNSGNFVCEDCEVCTAESCHVLLLLHKFEIECSATDWSKVPIDTKILVSADGEIWYKRYFAKYDNGKIYAWDNGCTSRISSIKTLWKYATLYREE